MNQLLQFLCLSDLLKVNAELLDIDNHILIEVDDLCFDEALQEE